MLYRVFIFITIGVLTGCGFSPLYGPQASGSQGLHSIKVRVIAEREGQILRNKLVHALTPYGQPRHPEYELDVTLDYGERDLGIAKDATTTRSQITLKATYILKDFRTGKVMYTDKVETMSDYNILKTSYYSNIVSEKTAREDLLNEVADSIKVALASFLEFQRSADENNPCTI